MPLQQNPLGSRHLSLPAYQPTKRRTVLWMVPSIILGGKLASARHTEASPWSDLVDESEKLLRAEMDQIYPAVVDRKRGGFHQNFDANWIPIPDTDCMVVAQARHTWTAALLAEHWPDRHKQFEEIARHGIAFLSGPMSDSKEGGLFFNVGADGKARHPEDDQKHTYGLAFALYAAAYVHRVTADATARQLAIDTFLWLDQHAHDPQQGGYWDALQRNGQPIATRISAETLSGPRDRLGVPPGLKTMNTHIHLLEALVELVRIAPKEIPQATDRLKELFDLVAHRFTNPPGALTLYFTGDWRPTPAHNSFGHDVETAFLLEEAAETIGTNDALQTAHHVGKQLVDHALEVGFDRERGGFYDRGEVFGNPIDTAKVWWAQAEGLHALARLHARLHANEDRYGQSLRKLWRFVTQHSVDRQRGGWFWQTDVEGIPEGPSEKLNAWKCGYHTARSLIGMQSALKTLD